MKQVIQLSADGYFAGLTVADESPLEPGVFHLPAGAIDEEVPEVPEGKRAKWTGRWVFEDIPQHDVVEEPEPVELTYAQKRAAEYPSIGDQLDALFHAGVFPAEMAAQIQAVKDKYPKA